MTIEKYNIDSKVNGKAENFEIKFDTSSEQFQNDVERIRIATGIKHDDAFFLNRQLNFAKQRINEPIYADLKLINGGLLPTVADTPLGADSVSYPSMDGVGKAQALADMGDDIPLAEVKATESTEGFVNFSLGYKYTWQDQNRSNFAGGSFNIITRKALYVRRGLDENANNILGFGYSQNNKQILKGMYNHPDVTNTQVADGGSGTEWSNKTAQQIVDDVRGAFDTIYDETNGSGMPDTMQVSQAVFRKLEPLNISTEVVSPKERLERDLGIRIEPVTQLNNKFTGNTNGFVLYKNDPFFIESEVPLRLQTLSPILKSELETLVPSVQRLGSVKLYQPKSIRYYYGI